MSTQTLKVEVTLFEKFSITINGKDVTPDGTCREFLAMMFAYKGKEVTAKCYWFHVFREDKIPFHGGQFTRAHMEVTSYLRDCHVEEILNYSLMPMRSCRIDCNKVSCDYFKMLNGEIPFGRKEDFLPEYKWASEVFKKSWQ